MNYKWLLFDIDGTLFDYVKAEENALQKSFEQTGISFEARFLPAYRTINDQLWREFERGQINQQVLKTRRFELLFETLEVDCDPQEFSVTYLANLAGGTFLMAGAAETVKSLSQKFNLAIITNGLTDVQRPRLANSVINRYIKALIISEEVGAAKPDPQIFDIAFERMNHPAKREVLIIGDSLSSDIQGGYNYGIDTCWFNPTGKVNGQVTATFEIQALPELPGILGVVAIPEEH